MVQGSMNKIGGRTSSIPLESSFIPSLLQKIFTGTHWNTIDLVVRAHQAAGMTFLYAALERRLVRVLQILLGHLLALDRITLSQTGLKVNTSSEK
jgi:hypothetical protein